MLTEPGLSTIVHGIIIARKIFARIRNFLHYRIAATFQLLVFFFIAVFTFRPIDYQPSDYETISGFPDKELWPEFFHMPVLMLILITVLNDGTLIAVGYDNVTARNTPEKWNLPALFAISLVLAAIACVSSLILLYFSLDSWRSDGLYQSIGLGGLSFGQVITSLYLKISVSDFLTLFSCRTGSDFFWTTKPSIVLVIAGGFALTISTILACVWPASKPDNIVTLGLVYRDPVVLAIYIWIYCFCWFVFQDLCKVGAYKLMIQYNWFQYNDTGKVVLPESTIKYIEDHKTRDNKDELKGSHH